MSATDDSPEWDGLGGQWTLRDPDNEDAWLTSTLVVMLDDVA
jgi:hypothetical protein